MHVSPLMIQHNKLAIQIQHTLATRVNSKVSFLNMEELEEDTRHRLTVDIRILSNKKKSLHRTARIKGFPVTETCEDFREEVKNILPGEKFSDNFSFGFIGKKQKKIWAFSDNDLADAYAAAINGQALWVDSSHSVVMDEEGNNKEKQGNKRKHKFSNKSMCFQIFF